MHAVNTEHRDLTLMFTDIVGYSRLMGRDEALTIDMLGQYREILLSHIRAQNGVLVEFAGDAIFARFDSPLEAVNAAIAIQQHLSAFNETRDKKLPRLQTRIGLHKGEVTLRDNAVFGDSVNIAARLEPLAVPDAICISQTVYDDIRFTLSSPAKPLGNQTLKNIDHKVRAYLIKPSGIGWRDHLHYFLRGLNRKIVAYRYPLTACLIALIAAGIYFIPRWLVPGYAANYVEIADFKNLMDEKGEADYFSAGITEAVRSQLADMRDVYIVNPKEGVHAPIRLEGSVQKLGDNLRIAYRLFRRKNNVQIAGGKLDGTYQDIFILQDRLVGEIARYLADEFELQNFRPAPLKLTNDITAYDYYLQGMEFLNRPTTHENIDLAIQHFNTALVHDKQFSLANTGICEAYWQKYELVNAAQWLNNAERHCLSALNQNVGLTRAYKAIGAIYRDTGQYEKSVEYLEKGLLIDAYDATTGVALASVYNIVNEREKAEVLYLELIKKSPKNWRVYDGYGYFLFKNGRHDEAIKSYNKVLELTPENALALNNLASMYLFKNDFKSAARLLERAAMIDPNAAIFANTGNMYYFSKEYSEALIMYKKALNLEPQNYQYIVSIADTYKYILNGENNSQIYFKMAIKIAREEIETNPQIAKAYYFLAISLAHLGDIKQANEVLAQADPMDGSSAEAFYSHLRVSILSDDNKNIRKYVRYLLDLEYSESLLLADPDFSILKDNQFRDLFKTQMN